MRYPTIEITTLIGCPNRCKYCPQDKLLNAYVGERVLTLSNFKACLKTIPKNVIITFSGFAEPFLNPQCAEMIKYAHSQGYKVSLYSTLRGLTQEGIKTIKNVSFYNLVIHLPDKGMSFNFKKGDYLSILKQFDKAFSPFYIYFGDKKDFPFIKRIKSKICNRAGNLYKIKKKEGSVICSKGKPCPVLLPNGEVVLCCMDYGLKHKLGNLLVNSWKDLFLGKEWKRILYGLCNPEVDILCRGCSEAIPKYAFSTYFLRLKIFIYDRLRFLR